MLNVLVVGGAGYIGSHACKVLANGGYRPVVYDNLSRGNRWAVKWGPFEQGDIADRARVLEVLEKYQIGAVMHFAAFAYVGESIEYPFMYYENNFCGAAALLKSVCEYGKIPLVFSSTCATYGTPSRVPIGEDQPQHPINPYGRSKLFVEGLLRDLAVSFGLPWVALRYFNAAGADPGGEIGEAHDPEPHLIPSAIIAAQTGHPLKIFGTDYPTEDGTCVRDFVHVMDIADAHVRALKYLISGGKSRALNLANAKGYSVKEVVAATEKIIGLRVPTSFAPRRPGDPAVLIGDARAAKALLGWEPRMSDLNTQIADAWNWHNKFAKRTSMSRITVGV